LIDLRSKGINGKLAENTLVKAGITINKNMVPFDTASPMVTSGMRIGTPAVTSRGLGTSEMKEIVGFIDNALMNSDNEAFLANLKHEIEGYMSKFPLY
jgi:glycine hydroxymethyltransferase